MTDPNISNPPAPLPPPAPVADPVQELVDQAIDIQQTFQNSDADDPSAQIPQPQITDPVHEEDSLAENNVTATDPLQTVDSIESVSSTQSPLEDLLQGAQASEATPVEPVPEQPTTNDTATKSPLDILEEILGKSEGGEAGDAPSDVPKVPEKSPEEIEAERVAIADAERIQLEQQREVLLREISSPEQQQREVIRTEQSKLLKSDDQHDIYQIKREKVMMQE